MHETPRSVSPGATRDVARTTTSTTLTATGDVGTAAARSGAALARTLYSDLFLPTSVVPARRPPNTRSRVLLLAQPGRMSLLALVYELSR